MIDFSGHVSARIPSTGEILINHRASRRCEVTEGDIIKVDLEGKKLVGEGEPPSEVFIHTSIYKARPEVMAVAHIHPPVTTSLGIAGKPIVPVIYHGAIFADGVPVYDDCRHVNTPERGEAMTKVMGSSRAVIIRGHGATVAADSVKAVFFASVYLEDNARQLFAAHSVGEPKVLRPEELAEGPKIWHEFQFNKIWNYYVAKMSE